MLILLFALVFYLFLLVGATAFLICVAIPPTRRFALSAALWFVLCGLCALALMTIAGLTLVGGIFLADKSGIHLNPHPQLLSIFSWVYLTLGVIVTAAIASAGAGFHQFLTHRFTFALFRLYATVVVAGIGSVFGWGFGWWLLSLNLSVAWLASLAGMLLLVASFGIAGYKGAHKLRGQAPTKLTWITEEEFMALPVSPSDNGETADKLV